MPNRILSPKAVAMTRRKREARRRQSERWRRADRALEIEQGRVLGADLAWRRWSVDEPECEAGGRS